jgi:hypothetical protein
MHNNLNAIKNVTTDPYHLQTINNMLGKLDVVKPMFQQEVKHNPGFAFADKLGNFTKPNAPSNPHMPSKISGGSSSFHAPVATGTLLSVGGAFLYTA